MGILKNDKCMDILSVKDLSEYLCCSKSSIRKLVRENKIKFFRIGSKINFTLSSVNEYILEQENIDKSQ